jgi:hypothetical protein
MPVEQMVFETPAHVPASIFLFSGIVVGMSAGREAPAKLTSVTLPVEPSTPGVGQPIERIRLGMTPSTIGTIYGDATWTVHSTFKGLPVLVLAYADPNGTVFARFTFVGGALTEMSM